MTTAQRITLAIPTLTSGGAERVLTTMANYWAGQGWQVTVVTLVEQDDLPFYPLHPAVVRNGIGVLSPSGNPLQAIARNVGRLRALRSAIVASRPDVVISFLDRMNVLTLLATRGTGIPVIASEHTDPNLAARHKVWDRLRNLTYPRAAQIVVLSDSAKQFFSPSLQDRIRIVPNPIVVDVANEPPVRNGHRRIAALGRLGPEKGFDLLISAFSQVSPQFPDWELVIWGEGVLRPELEAQRSDSGVAGRIALPGRTTTPHRELRTADLYVLSSRREGFPMALAEAMACGLPAVAFDLPSGPRSIIREGVDGVLVSNGDVAALADGMSKLMADDALRSRMAARAPEVLERFGVERVMAIWQEIIDGALEQR